METEQMFGEDIERRHDYARNWKSRTGGKVIGYFCNYVPEEIITAAGMLPVRVIASQEPPTLAERYMPSGFTCTFARGCLHSIVKGDYNYLDGLVMPVTCYHIRAPFYYARSDSLVPATHRIDFPKALERRGTRTFVRKEFELFKEWLEKLRGRSISEDELLQGIERYNDNRRLMRSIYQLRKGDYPLLNGVEALEMVLSSQLTAKEEHSARLRAWLAALEERKPARDSRIRLMVVGSVIDKTEVLQLIENQGAIVVADDLCTGSRYFWDDVVAGGDALSALAGRYIDKVSCPSMIAGDRRFRHIETLIADYGVQGVIVLHQKFCTPHGNDYPYLKQWFVEKDIPHILLETDIPTPGGQIRSRVQTLVEMLQAELI